MHDLDACPGGTVKLQRAHGGCLGDQRRRRTWTAAISFGEPLTGFDPKISEWGNPCRDYRPACGEYIAIMQQTQGTETSKYLEEKKAIAYSLSSGERTGKSLNLLSVNIPVLLSRGRGISWEVRYCLQRVIKEGVS